MFEQHNQRAQKNVLVKHMEKVNRETMFVKRSNGGIHRPFNFILDGGNGTKTARFPRHFLVGVTVGSFVQRVKNSARKWQAHRRKMHFPRTYSTARSFQCCVHAMFHIAFRIRFCRCSSVASRICAFMLQSRHLNSLSAVPFSLAYSRHLFAQIGP